MFLQREKYAAIITNNNNNNNNNNIAVESPTLLLPVITHIFSFKFSIPNDEFVHNLIIIF